VELAALSQMARAIQNGDIIDAHQDLITLKTEMAIDLRLDPHFRALALAVPSESEIARELAENVDVDSIHKARRLWITQIAKSTVSSKNRSYDLRPSDVFAPDAKQAGARAIANAVLELECLSFDQPELALEAFTTANNMTDRLAALSIMAGHFPDAAQTSASLSAFRAQFDGNALVLDKWLTLIASMPGQGALARVQAAMADPVYDETNPNRVRSLFGTFAMANPTGFHRADGSAYVFFESQLLALDKINPQVAARVMTSVRSWRAIEALRREKLRAAIARIVSQPGISRDLADIAGRTLG
jgi:aminopeptidase N